MKTPNGVTVIAALSIVAVVAVVALVPDDADLAVLLVLVGNLLVTIINATRTDQVRATVDDLANGKMDAKVRAGVADVLADHLVDPKARAQVERDREVRGDH